MTAWMSVDLCDHLTKRECPITSLPEQLPDWSTVCYLPVCLSKSLKTGKIRHMRHLSAAVLSASPWLLYRTSHYPSIERVWPVPLLLTLRIYVTMLVTLPRPISPSSMPSPLFTAQPTVAESRIASPLSSSPLRCSMRRCQAINTLFIDT